MKVLFLDIDGVLNNESTKEQIETVLGPMDAVDKRLLDKFMSWWKSRPDVKIVLSSSWRLSEDVFGPVFKDCLKASGINWIDETPNLGHRGEEIATWINAHTNDITHWAILDDEGNKIHPVGRFAVICSSKWGLRDKDLIKLDALLGYKV
jgi:hypothetical protein